ncbi:hypothetical protein OAN83_02750 [Alphaproteobacteria bacterium]|nr:hypothetical protein [Alphaproteobacteria bacterium]
MPILQNKLVWKSIESLHDESVATMPDADIGIGIIKSRPTAILQQSSATQTPLKTPRDDDVVARIDQLLRKLDEDNDAPTAQSAPAANNQAPSTELADEATATVNLANDAAASVSAPDDAAADMRNNDPVQIGQAQALNDIAAAIHQAQQSRVDSDAPPAGPDLTPAFDMNVLSATIADEVRHSVSEMIAAEMPQMVHQAVVEAIREMPTAAAGQPKPKAAKKTRTKSGPAKKATAKKATAKKAAAKKAGSQKTSATISADDKATP